MLHKQQTNGAHLSKAQQALKSSLCYLDAKSLLTLGHPTDCSPQGSSVHGISQARILEWVATSFFRRSSQPRDRTCISCEFFTSEPPGKPLMGSLGGEKQHAMFTWMDMEGWALGGTLPDPLWPPYSSLIAVSVG